MAIFFKPGASEPADPLGVIRSYLATAIQIGAPAYNAGDHRGCYEVYACTARMLLNIIEGADEAHQALRQALQRCALAVDPNEQAWIMRHTFDALLGKDDN